MWISSIRELLLIGGVLEDQTRLGRCLMAFSLGVNRSGVGGEGGN